jgi:hypothetical protein
MQQCSMVQAYVVQCLLIWQFEVLPATVFQEDFCLFSALAFLDAVYFAQ